MGTREQEDVRDCERASGFIGLGSLVIRTLQKVLVLGPCVLFLQAFNGWVVLTLA